MIVASTKKQAETQLTRVLRGGSRRVDGRTLRRPRGPTAAERAGFEPIAAVAHEAPSAAAVRGRVEEGEAAAGIGAQLEPHAIPGRQERRERERDLASRRRPLIAGCRERDLRAAVRMGHE